MAAALSGVNLSNRLQRLGELKEALKNKNNTKVAATFKKLIASDKKSLQVYVAKKLTGKSVSEKQKREFELAAVRALIVKLNTKPWGPSSMRSTAVRPQTHLGGPKHEDGIGPLIRRYLPSTPANPAERADALRTLMGMGAELCKLEKLNISPTKENLPRIFGFAEDINLLRMMRSLHRTHASLPDAFPPLSRDIEEAGAFYEAASFDDESNEKPRDRALMVSIRHKATLVRNWMESHKKFFSNYSLPKQIMGIPWAERPQLLLDNCSLTLLPREVALMGSIRTLYLDYNKLIALPREIGQLSNLRSLHLQENRLSILPKQLWQLPLHFLQLRNNPIGSLPIEVSCLRTLKELDCTSCGLAELPREIGCLKVLEKLQVHGNQLTRLPKEIGQLSVLKEMVVSNNRLTEVPKEIGNLAALARLDLDDNQLSVLPREIVQLDRLTVLGLCRNRFRAVQPEFLQLRSLGCLYLSGNQIRALSEKDVLQSPALKWLDVEGNLLRELPSKIVKRRFDHLGIDDNGLIDLPKGLVAQRSPNGETEMANLDRQNRELQLLNIIEQLTACLQGGQNKEKLDGLLTKMEKLFGKECRSKLHSCFVEGCDNTWAKTDRLRKRFKTDPRFGRNGFLDPKIDSKLKLSAIGQFIEPVLKELRQLKKIEDVCIALEFNVGSVVVYEEHRKEVEKALLQAGPKDCAKLYACFRYVCNRNLKAHDPLRKKMKNPLFERNGLFDPSIPYDLKKAAVVQFKRRALGGLRWVKIPLSKPVEKKEQAAS